MRHVLIFTQGYFQTMLAIRMRQTVLKDCGVDLIITNASVGGKKLADNIRLLHLYNHVWFIECYHHFRPEVKSRRIEKFKGLFACLTGISKKYKTIIGNVKIDEMILFDISLDSISLFSYLERINKNIYASLMEEGILSYSTVNKTLNGYVGEKRNRLIKIRKIFGRNSLSNYKNIYVQFPNLINKKYQNKIIQIPVISFSDEEYRNLISHIFEMDKFEFTKPKLIYFSTTDLESDIALLEGLSSVIKKDDLMVKLHPRDYSDTIRNLGYAVYPHSEIPWEAITLVYDFSGSVFISDMSNATLLPYIFGQRIKIINLSQIETISNNSINIQKTLMESEQIIKKLHIKQKDYLSPKNYEEIKSFIEA